MLGGGAVRRRAQRGAAAVEAAILSAFVIVPLLFGVVAYGDYFWKAQRVNTLDVSGIPAGSVSGTYTCTGLTSRVEELLADNVAEIAGQAGVPASAVRRTVRVIRVLPDIGADVEVSLEVEMPSRFGRRLPLPNDGVVVKDFTQRLENVKVTTASC